jgi:hypothetical protein
MMDPTVESTAREVVETFYALPQDARRATPHELYEAIKALGVVLSLAEGR